MKATAQGFCSSIPSCFARRRWNWRVSQLTQAGGGEVADSAILGCDAGTELADSVSLMMPSESVAFARTAPAFSFELARRAATSSERLNAATPTAPPATTAKASTTAAARWIRRTDQSGATDSCSKSAPKRGTDFDFSASVFA